MASWDAPILVWKIWNFWIPKLFKSWPPKNPPSKRPPPETRVYLVIVNSMLIATWLSPKKAEKINPCFWWGVVSYGGSCEGHNSTFTSSLRREQMISSEMLKEFSTFVQARKWRKCCDFGFFCYHPKRGLYKNDVFFCNFCFGRLCNVNWKGVYTKALFL